MILTTRRANRENHIASRILLADDSATLQNSVKLILAREGIEVVAVSNGEMAKRLLNKIKPALVLADISLPGVNGYKLCEFIRDEPDIKDLPVVLLVGAFEPFNHAEALRVGADAHLAKSAEADTLVATVRKLIGSGEAENKPREGRYFKRFVAPPVGDDNAHNQFTAGTARHHEADLQAQPSKSSRLMTRAAFVCVLLIATGLTTWFAIDSSRARQAEQPSALNSLIARQPSPDAANAIGNLDYEEGEAGETLADSDNITATPVPPFINTGGARVGRQRAVRRDERDWTPRLSDLSFRTFLRERMLARASNLERRGMLDQSEQQYRAVLASFPDDPTSRFELSRIQANISARRQAEQVRASRHAGLKEFLSGNYAAAARNLTVAVKAGRTDTAVLYSLGMSNLRLGRSSEAKQVFERCLVDRSNYAPAIVGLAQVSAAEGKNSEAISLLNRALELGGGAEFTRERIRDMISRYSQMNTPRRD